MYHVVFLPEKELLNDFLLLQRINMSMFSCYESLNSKRTKTNEKSYLVTGLFR